MTNKKDPPANNPMRLMGQITRAFGRLVDGPLAELGMSVGQLPVLVPLARHGALPQSELVKIARVEQSSMAQMLSRMERDGLIVRTPDPADGRSRLISLTERALAHVPKGRLVMEGTSERGLAGLSQEERAQLRQLLARVLANLEQDEDGEEDQ